MIGQQLGNYLVMEELGRGGMGAVYKARHTALGREAAIKVLLPQYSSNADVVQRFFNEAKAATSIRHLGIVEIYDYGLMPDGVAYIAMELLRGESLASRMIQRRLTPTECLNLIRQICGALGAAHTAGIVHRDLKPDNVFLVRDDEVTSGERIKLLDFGIAKVKLEQTSQSQTRTGSLMGTPTYMSPEQCRGVAVDHRTDIYALGCILFEMVARRNVFVGEGVGDILGAHMFSAPASLDAIAPGLPTGMSVLVDRMLAKDAAVRPQTAGEVIQQIDRILLAQSNPSIHVAPSEPPSTVSYPTTLSSVAVATTTSKSKTRRGPLLLGGVLVAMVAAVIVSQRSSTTSVARPVQAVASVAIDAVVPDALSVSPPPIDAPTAGTLIKVDSDPVGAAVWWEGVELGRTPFEQRVNGGQTSIRLTLRLKGFQDTAIETAPGTDVTTRVVMAAHPKKTTRANTVPARTSAKAAAPTVKRSEDDSYNPYK